MDVDYGMKKVLQYVREQGLLQPGDRVMAAVSGGADSVALLRVLEELRAELGIVLSVGHFNHKIRGAEAEADEQFVRELSERLGLEFYCGSGDVPAHAREKKLSLETAARELRHAWFAEIVGNGRAAKIATAHTLDDQAETVLMRVLRGAGTRGLAGIAPWQREKRLVRPLLEITRAEIEDYLRGLKQPWREDASNRDLSHTRNRVRHELLPLLQRGYNPAIRQTLADVGEVARAEDAFLEAQAAKEFQRRVREGKPGRDGRNVAAGQKQTLAIELAALSGIDPALQRRVLRRMAEELGGTLEFKHIQQILLQQTMRLAGEREGRRKLELPGGLIAMFTLRELQITREVPATLAEYCYKLTVPGEVAVPELGATIRAQVVRAEAGNKGYNPALLLDRKLLAAELTVRNWRAGDRFFPAHTHSPKRVKELLQAGRLGQDLSAAERKAWPVIESGGEIVWMRGFPVPAAFETRSEQAVLIEEIRTDSQW